MGKMDLHHSSKETTWETPDELFDFLNMFFQFDMDVAATEDNAKVSNFISPEEDTFKTPWLGTCWMNPPYGKPERACPKDRSKCKKKKCKDRGYHIDENVPGVGDFARLLAERVEDPDVDQAVILLPARVDTDWFKVVWEKAELILFIEGRLSFRLPDGARDPAPFPSAIAVFGNRPADNIFEELTAWGTIIDPQHGGIMLSTKE